MNFFENKKILVTGGTGMVGMALIKNFKWKEDSEMLGDGVLLEEQ